MVYPKRIDWNHGSSGHPTPPAPRSQRDLVAASLLRCRPGSRLRWDERTRSEYRSR